LHASVRAQRPRERRGQTVRDTRADRVVQEHHVEAREIDATRCVLRPHGVPKTVARVQCERLEIIAHRARMKPPGVIEHQDIEAVRAEGAIWLVRHRVIFSRDPLEDPQSLRPYSPDRSEASIASASRQYSFNHLRRPERGVVEAARGSSTARDETDRIWRVVGEGSAVYHRARSEFPGATAMRIVMLAGNDWLDDSRIIREAESLARHGHAVHVLCAGRLAEVSIVNRAGVTYHRLPMGPTSLPAKARAVRVHFAIVLLGASSVRGVITTIPSLLGSIVSLAVAALM